jgi:hypothetical protein
MYRILIIGCSILTVALIVWLTRTSHKLQNENVSVATQASPTPNATAGSDLVADVPFLTPQQKAIVERIEKKLPIEANTHRLVRSRIADESPDALVKNSGEIWAVAESVSFSSVFDATDTESLIRSFKDNLRLKRLIEVGREQPAEMISRIAKDLATRIDRWEHTVDAYDELCEMGGGGIAVSDKGTVTGGTVAQTFHEDRYAIPAELFVLANLRSQEALPLISLLIKRIQFVQTSGDNPKRHLPRTINTDVPYWVAISLLPESGEARYTDTKKAISDKWTNKVLCREEEVLSPHALWNANNIAVTSGRVRISDEPKMNLLFPVLDELSKVPSGEKIKILVMLAMADKQLPAAEIK